MVRPRGGGGALSTANGTEALERAHALIAAGRPTEAGDALARAARDRASVGDGATAARLYGLAAGLARASGDLATAHHRVVRAGALAAEGDADPWVAAEWAEQSLVAGDADGACRIASGGLARLEPDEPDRPDSPAGARARLLRARARARAALGDADGAIADLAASMDSGSADEEVPGQLVGSPLGAVVDDLLAASGSLAARNLAAARTAAASARGRALELGQPWLYAAAALVESRAAEGLGDSAAAYARLAAGAATLADVVGRDVSMRVFGPALVELRDRWGAKRFASVKTAHDDQRRMAR